MTPAVATSAARFALDAPTAEVSARDRLTFALFLAGAIHVAVILGIGFAMPESREPTRSLEVTLAQHQSREAPDDADFLAQADQEGSGTLDEAVDLMTDRAAGEDDRHLAEVAEPLPETAPDAPVPPPQVSSTESSSQAVQETEFMAETEADPGMREMMLNRAQALASIDARQSDQVQMDARGPRVRRITSASTRTAVEAAYVNSWRNKIESIGNLNYPAEARRRSLEGDLRVLVEIDSSGALRDVRILDSSGSAILDEAAMRIVRLGAPFLPFPEEMRREADILQIVRTWQFRRGMVDSRG